MPLVSVILINYNQNALTAACIKSIYHQTSEIDFEIIVVDNASPDANPDELANQFPGIKLIKSSDNLGFAGGNNLGIHNANGDYILLLNNDATIENNAIKYAYDFLLKYPTCAAVGARILNANNDQIQHNCQRFPSVKYPAIELLRLQKFLPSKKAGKLLLGSFFTHDKVIFPDWIWATFLMFPRTSLNCFPQNKLPQNFFMYFEDVQWCMEWRRHGYTIGFEPKAIIRHLKEGSKGDKNAYMINNEKMFMRMYYSWWHRSLIDMMNFLLKKLSF